MEYLDKSSYVIKQKTGKSNVVVDALSRRDTLLVSSCSQILGFDDIKHDNNFSSTFA